jgi:gliding motility-associated lipoprotein GldH
MHYKSILLVFITTILIQSCIPSNVFEKNFSFKNHNWDQKVMPQYTFDISDTLSNYGIYITMRHTDAYPYANIWLNIETTDPDNKTLVQKVELPLAETTGKWLGQGMDEIFEHKISLTKNQESHFNKKGKYIIKLKHIMRQNPLPQIMSIGVRLEKVRSQ